MLRLSSHIGKGIHQVVDPKACLEWLMPAVVGWGQAVLGCDPNFSSLYKAVNAFDFKRLDTDGQMTSVTVHTFRVTRSHLECT